MLYCIVLCYAVLYRIVLNLVLCICVWVRTSERRHIEYTMDDDCVDDDGEVDKFLDICQCVRVCVDTRCLLCWTIFAPHRRKLFKQIFYAYINFSNGWICWRFFVRTLVVCPFFAVIDTFSLTVLGVNTTLNVLQI